MHSVATLILTPEFKYKWSQNTLGVILMWFVCIGDSFEIYRNIICSTLID